MPLKLKHLKTSVLLIFIALMTLAVPVSAQTESEKKHFETKLRSTYTVDVEGDTFVEHVFEIKNLTPEYLITKYGLKVGSNQLNNIQVTEDSQLIEPQIEKKDSYTSIDVKFKDEVVGKDQVRKFSISYQNPDIAHVNGQVLEVNIPKMANTEDYDQHQVVLITPKKFGKPSRITPKNYNLAGEDETYAISYDRLQGRGLSAIFGDKQFFDLTIRYHLDNPNNQPAITQISLPPDTAYQKINYQQLQPKPEEIKVDQDGNWIATYYLLANKTTEVNLKASVMIGTEFVNPQIQPQPLQAHVKEEKFWPVNHNKIHQIAQNKSAQEIYQYTVEKLSCTEEELTRDIKRLGTLEALANPDKATCQEFTDLFVTLARANNIPARRVTGYAYSQNPKLRPLSLVTDVLHTWPEYYDFKKKVWVPVDPTWGSSTQGVDYFNQFDLNHIAFAINGKSSQLPYPAGAYKLEKKETKDIKVDFAQSYQQSQPKFELTAQPRKLFNLVPIPGYYQLKIINQTGQAWYQTQLEYSQLPAELKAQINSQEFDLLPYQTKTVDFKLYNNKSWLLEAYNLKFELKTKANQELKQKQTSQTYELKLQSIGPIRQLFQRQEAIYALGGIGLILTLAAGGLLVFRRRQ
jgi:transglutaminase-like putative cysteine protease